MSNKYKYEPVDKTGCDLVTLKEAAKVVYKSKNAFNVRALKHEVPPPVHDTSMRYWSRRQLEAFNRGEIKALEDGLWYRWDEDAERWKLIPNQYRVPIPIPSDTA